MKMSAALEKICFQVIYLQSDGFLIVFDGLLIIYHIEISMSFLLECHRVIYS